MWRRFCSTWTTRFGSIERWGGKQPQVRHFMLNTAHATPYLASVSFPPTLPYTCVLRLHTVATPRTTRRPNELDNDISSQSGPLVACLLFHHNFPFLSTYSFNSFAHGTPLVSGVRASRACMGTPGRPAAPRYRARANGIHCGTHSVPRLQLMGHIRGGGALST